LPDAGNAVWYSYAGKAGTTVKSGTPDAGNFTGREKGYAGKFETIVKSGLPDAGNAVRYGYAGKAGSKKSP
jgi:hypothetical protein